MSVDEVNTFLFSEDLMIKIKNNLDLLLSYGVVGYYEIETIKYYEILEAVQKIAEWYRTEATKEDVIRWMFFFENLVGMRHVNKFIMALNFYNMNMGWK